MSAQTAAKHRPLDGTLPLLRGVEPMAEDVVREEKPARASGGEKSVRGISSGSLITARTLSEISATEEKSRIITGISELDRVLGGGIVQQCRPLGGEPGAGKSTLLLQLCGAINKAVSVVYHWRGIYPGKSSCGLCAWRSTARTVSAWRQKQRWTTSAH